MWSKKFLAKTKTRGSKLTLLGQTDVPSSSQDLSNTDADRRRKAARKVNNQAYRDLLLCIMDDVAFGIADGCCTEDLPNGDAAMAWRKLTKNTSHQHQPTK